MNTIDSLKSPVVDPVKQQVHRPTGPEHAAPTEPEKKKQLERAQAPLAKAAGDGKPDGNQVAAAPSEMGARVVLSVDLQLKETIIRVVDPQTGETLRQIPPDEVLRQRRAYQKAQTEPQAPKSGQESGKDGSGVA
jgi:uncharacterized FlaG/YvyC family protein